MTSSSDRLDRHDRRGTVVLSGAATRQVRPARISADLRTTAFASGAGVDPRLVDPSLIAVVAEAEERARRAGWEQGRLDGLEAGRREAAAEESGRARQAAAEAARREQAFAAALSAVRLAATELDARDAVVFESIDHTVATMAVEIAEVLIGRYLELDGIPALDAVQRALALAPRQSEAVLRLHPDTVALLPELGDAMPGGSITIVPDPTVDLHGCIVEVGDRTIDAQLDAALQRLREVIA